MANMQKIANDHHAPIFGGMMIQVVTRGGNKMLHNQYTLGTSTSL